MNKKSLLCQGAPRFHDQSSPRFNSVGSFFIREDLIVLYFFENIDREFIKGLFDIYRGFC